MYFGPREEAGSWFKSIGFSRLLHRSELDFLATICDPSFRHEYIPRHTGSSTPMNVYECTKRIAACSIAEEIRRAMEQDAVGTPPGQEKEVSLEPSPRLAKVAKRKNLQNLWRQSKQSKILAGRETKLVRAKRSELLLSFLRNVVFGIVLGSIFWQLPTTQQGASTYAGLLFLALLFIRLSSLSALAAKHAEKEVMYKQRSARFFLAFPYIVAVAVMDLLQAVLNAAGFLIPRGEQLLYAILILSLVQNIMLAICNALVALSEKADAAQTAAGLPPMIFVFISGFLKNCNALQSYIVWIYWSNPAHYITRLKHFSSTNSRI